MDKFIPNDTEEKIIALVNKGYSCNEIANKLLISNHTVKAILKLILKKSNNIDKTFAVKMAIEKGLL